MPPVLAFQYEMLLDARRFERPANYALLRITTVGEEHAEDCIDDTQAAGHRHRPARRPWSGHWRVQARVRGRDRVA